MSERETNFMSSHLVIIIFFCPTVLSPLTKHFSYALFNKEEKFVCEK